jgi:hypothetical protein
MPKPISSTGPGAPNTPSRSRGPGRVIDAPARPALVKAALLRRGHATGAQHEAADAPRGCGVVAGTGSAAGQQLPGPRPARQAQPAMKARPPSGVMAPSQRSPGETEEVQAAGETPGCRARRAPGAGLQQGGSRVLQQQQPTSEQREAVIELVLHRGFVDAAGVVVEAAAQGVGTEGTESARRTGAPRMSAELRHRQAFRTRRR